MPLETELSHRDWTIVLRGRADGIFGEEVGTGPLRVEEVKTGLGPWHDESPMAEAHRLQAAVYGWMLARTTGREVRSCIVWLAHGAAAERHPVESDADAVERRVRAELDVAIDLVLQRERRRARRAAARVYAPFARWRPGQPELVAATERAIERREHLCVEAPTGSGKTAAVLHAATGSALRHDLPLVWVTARRTQQALPLATLERLAPKELPFAVQLRSLAAMCTTGARWCRPEACRLAGDPAGRGPALLEALLPRGVLSAQSLVEAGTRDGVCPYHLAHAARRETPVLLADFNHLVDPVVQLSGPPDEDPLEDAILVVDEFHQLVDRARDAGSLTLPASLLRAALERSALGATPRHRAEREVCEALLQLLLVETADAGLDAVAEDRVWIPAAHPLEAWAELLERLQSLRLDGLVENGPIELGEPDPLAQLDLCLSELCRDRPGRGTVALLGRSEGGPAWRRFELDPAPRLAPLWKRARCVIGLSATLRPAELHRDALGLEPERTRVLELPSPFPAERLRVVIDPKVDTRYRNRGRALPAIVRRIAAFARAVPGNTLIVLPSHAMLAEVRALLPGDLGWLEAQGRDEDDALRASRMERLASRRDVLLLAVAGGLYTEGIDLPGEALLGVLVVGPCLPPPTTERRLIAEHHDEWGGNGHEAAFAVPGMNRVVQAVGRLIRTQEDRGVAALLGRRFLREPYQGLLPPRWWTDGGPEDHVGDPAAEAVRFFARTPEARRSV